MRLTIASDNYEARCTIGDCKWFYRGYVLPAHRADRVAHAALRAHLKAHRMTTVRRVKNLA